MWEVGQKVIRVRFRKGHPFIEYGTVTNVNKCISVNGKRLGSGHGWARDIFEAIDNAYLEVFKDGQRWFDVNYLGIDGYIKRICRLRRLEAKFRKFKKCQG